MVHSISRGAQGQLALIYDVRQTFLSYFPYRHRTIFKNIDGKGWFTINNKTALSDELIIEAVSGQKKCFRGLRWGQQTRFAVLDIDSNSIYHNPLALAKIKQALTTIGITNTPCYQSSISTGWHLYIPLADWEQSDEVTNSLKGFLRLKDFQVTSGTLEVFPSGAGLRLPLQFGFAWLDSSGDITVRREDLGADEALRRFVHDIESGGNDWTYTKLRISEELETADRQRREKADRDKEERVSEDGFDDLFQSRLIEENYELGKMFWREGLSKRGQRHDAVICVEHYLWHGDSQAMVPALPGRANDEQRAQLIRQWLERHHNGCCSHINSGDWKTVDNQIARACKWRSEVIPERIPYALMSDRAIDRITILSRTTSRTWTPEDWKKGNDKRRLAAREKIASAVETLLEQGRKISGRVIAEMTGCSRNTVRHHADLWLQCGSGDLEPGVSGDLLVFDQLNEDEIQESQSSNVVRLFENLKPKNSGFISSENFEISKVFSEKIEIVSDFSEAFPEDRFERASEISLESDLESSEIDLRMGLVLGGTKNSLWRQLEGYPVAADCEIDSGIWSFNRCRSRSPPGD